MQVYQIEFGTPEYDEAVGIRHEVLRKPLGLEYTPEQLAAEYDQIHLAAFADSGRMLGYLCLQPLDESTVKMRQVAVSLQMQGKGVGRAMVAYSEVVAARMGFSRMVLHAREVAVPFYLKLDYTIEGDRFEEVNIPHFKMAKPLDKAMV
jgi:predicted GNAT family N-acyltransferase